MAWFEDLDETQLLLGLALLIGGVYLYQRYRFATSTPGGAGSFSPNAPAGDILTRSVGELVPLDVSPNGQAFIKTEEGLSLSPRNDAGRQSIGWGHTIAASDGITGPITIDRAQQLFDADISETESVINQAVAVALSQNQFDALASLEFNIGQAAFDNSTLLRLLNAGDYSGAASQFAVWNKSRRGGSLQVDPVLVGRRSREQNLFGTG